MCVCILADVALSNTLQRFNYILETVFQHAEKWEAPDVKDTGKKIISIYICTHTLTVLRLLKLLH